jgi:hypothetical protein
MVPVVAVVVAATFQITMKHMVDLVVEPVDLQPSGLDPVLQ